MNSPRLSVPPLTIPKAILPKLTLLQFAWLQQVAFVLLRCALFSMRNNPEQDTGKPPQGFVNGEDRGMKPQMLLNGEPWFLTPPFPLRAY